MGLTDRITGNRKEIDHFELKVKSSTGGWSLPSNEFREFETELDGIGDLDEGLDKEIVEQTAEAEGWPAGEYRLLAMAVGGGVAEHVWVLEWDGPDIDQAGGQEELTPMEQMMATQNEILARLDEDKIGATTSPDEAMGRLFDQAIESERVTWDQMVDFVRSWRGPPTDPDEFAGAMVQSQLEAGNQEAAAGLLTNWMGSRGGSGDSLVDLATSLDGDELNFDSVKTLGMLKFLDDPQSMTRDMASGFMQAGGAEAGGSRGGTIEGLFSQGGSGTADQDAGAAEPADDGPAVVDDEPAEADDPGEPGVDPAASGADFDVAVDVDDDPADVGEAAEEAGAEGETAAAAFDGASAASAAPAETEIEPDPDDDAGDDGGESFDEAREDLEDQADAGEPASADEAVARLSDADAEDEEVEG